MRWKIDQNGSSESYSSIRRRNDAAACSKTARRSCLAGRGCCGAWAIFAAVTRRRRNRPRRVRGTRTTRGIAGWSESTSEIRGHRVSDELRRALDGTRLCLTNIELLGDHDIAVMELDGFTHPLSAVYRLSTLPHIEELLEEGKLRLSSLSDVVHTRRVRPEEMLPVDPELRSLRNLNKREDYVAALAAAGLSPEK